MAKFTTSIRLDSDMRQKLEQASRHLHRGINWIVDQALKRYLSELHQDTLIHEARRQSILASTHQHPDDDVWHNNVDFDDWK